MIKISNKDRIIAVIVLVVIVFALIAAFMLTSPNKQEIMTAVNTELVVDGTKISKGFYNYFYEAATSSAVLARMDQYDNFDRSLPLEEQYYDEKEGITWEDYFVNSSIGQISRIVYLYNRAKEQGIELHDEQKKSIDSQLNEIRTEAEKANISVNDYTSIVYGDHVGIKTIEKILKMSFMAQNYYEYFCINTEFSQSELSDYYAEKPDKVNVVSFECYAISYESESVDDTKKFAQNIFDSLCETDNFYNSLIENGVVDEILSSYKTYKHARISECTDLPPDVTDWLYDPGRTEGEKNLFICENEQLAVVLKVNIPVSRCNDIGYSVREILIEYDKDGETMNAEESAQNIISEVENSDIPEYTFAVLADIYNTDSSNEWSGGLVVGIMPDDGAGQLYEWMTNDGRVYGDITMIEGNNGIYLYFYMDKSENWKYSVRKQLLDNTLTELFENVDVH